MCVLFEHLAQLPFVHLLASEDVRTSVCACINYQCLWFRSLWDQRKFFLSEEKTISSATTASGLRLGAYEQFFQSVTSLHCLPSSENSMGQWILVHAKHDNRQFALKDTHGVKLR